MAERCYTGTTIVGKPRAGTHGDRRLRFRINEFKEYLVFIVKQPHCTVVAWLSIFTLLTGTEMADAGPFRAVFRALHSSIGHREHKTRPHRSSDTHNEAPPSDGLNRDISVASISAPSEGRNVRLAKVASGAKQEKSNLPYGTPVPGKAGLVTSPFAPDSGYVDVRTFPPGTKVKDPYTGKIFLTP